MKPDEVTLRSSGLWNVVPGEVVTVTPRKHWSYARHPYLSGDITGTRLDIAALRLGASANHAHLLVRTGTRPLPHSMRSILAGNNGGPPERR